MSLDVYLLGEQVEVECVCSCGNKHASTTRPYFYQDNITHNLGRMAEAAGIYEALWRPDEIGLTLASQLIAPLEEGLRKLKADPIGFAQFNAPNGWGLYEHFVPFTEKYLEACKQYPEAKVRASR